jgi:hypothetical protein
VRMPWTQIRWRKWRSKRPVHIWPTPDGTAFFHSSGHPRRLLLHNYIGRGRLTSLKCTEKSCYLLHLDTDVQSLSPAASVTDDCEAPNSSSDDLERDRESRQRPKRCGGSTFGAQPPNIISLCS